MLKSQSPTRNDRDVTLSREKPFNTRPKGEDPNPGSIPNDFLEYILIASGLYFFPFSIANSIAS
jgi:hypothetical protein